MKFFTANNIKINSMGDNKDSKKLPIITQSEIVAQSRLFNVEQIHLTFSNGEDRVYERIKGGGRGAVLVVPMIDDNTMLLIKEYSAGTHDYQLGFPKGLIDPGESVLDAANRELKEEIGFGANELVPLKVVSLAPGFFNAKMTILFARDLYPERLEGDEPEELEVVRWRLDDFESLLVREDFTESRSVSALFLAREWLAKSRNDNL